MSAAVAADRLISGDVEVPTRRPQSSTRRHGAGNQGNLAPQGTGLLHGSELAVIHERTKSLQPAIKTVERILESVQDLRVKTRAYRDEHGGGVWSSLILTLRGSSTLGLEPREAKKRSLEYRISAELSELRKVIERVIVPSLAGVREIFRGRTFKKTAETPKALLLVSIPTEKVGKIFSFDVLRTVTRARTQRSTLAKTVDGGDGRIILVRTLHGKEECLEFSYLRPGKVDVYLDGKRQGGMWTDDAYNVVRAFSRGQELTFKKQKRFTEYTVY